MAGNHDSQHDPYATMPWDSIPLEIRHAIISDARDKIAMRRVRTKVGLWGAGIATVMGVVYSTRDFIAHALRVVFGDGY